MVSVMPICHDIMRPLHVDPPGMHSLLVVRWDRECAQFARRFANEYAYLLP